MSRFRILRTLHFVTLSAIVALSLSPLSAQMVGGTIAGTVVDPSNGTLDQVKVVIRNEETGTERNLTTSGDGAFSAPSIPIGVYSVSAQKDGFAPLKRTGIAVVVGQTVQVRLVLTVGKIQQVVTVVDTPAAVDTSTLQTQGFVGERQVKELPLNGRSFDQLLELNPASVSYTTQRSGGVGTSNSSVGNMYTISGRRPQDNLFLLNGIEYTGASLINVTPGGTSGQLLGVEAVREFNAVSDTYGANYGKRTGAQVSIITASGNNEIHGSVYEFFRNSALDARNYFDQAQIPPFQRNDFGAALGGPLRRDKLFVFGNYEGYRQHLGLSDVTFVPDDAVRAAAVPSVQPLLALWPQGTVDLGQGIAVAYSSPPQHVREDFGTTRMDANLSKNDLLFGVYTIDDSDATTPSANPYSGIYESLREQVASVQEQHVFSPQLLNTFRFGYSRANFFFNSILDRFGAGLGFGSAGWRSGHLRQHRFEWGVTDHAGGCQHRQQQRHDAQSLHGGRSRVLDARAPPDRSRCLAAETAIKRLPRAESVWTGLFLDHNHFRTGTGCEVHHRSDAYGAWLALALQRRLYRRRLESDVPASNCVPVCGWSPRPAGTRRKGGLQTTTLPMV